MSTEPRVSVIIPCFNRAHLLRECLLSLREVASPDWEVIVVDDGSTENIRSVVETTMPTARYIRQDNQGAGAARNTGIKAARGRYIRFLDSDDYLLPGEGLQAQLDLMEADPEIGLVYGQSIKVNRLGKNTGVRRSPWGTGDYVRDGLEEMSKLLFYSYMTTSTTLVRRAALEDVGLFRVDLPTGEDWELWLRIARRYKVGYIDLPISFYRVHPESITGGKSQAEQMLRVHRRVLDELFSDPKVTDLYAHMLPELYLDIELRAAHSAWRSLQPKECRRYTLRALMSSVKTRKWGYALGSVRMLTVSILPFHAEAS